MPQSATLTNSEAARTNFNIQICESKMKIKLKLTHFAKYLKLLFVSRARDSKCFLFHSCRQFQQGRLIPLYGREKCAFKSIYVLPFI